MTALWKYRELIRQLLQRELAQEYRGSILGFLWALLLPLMDLAVYSFVFGVVFHTHMPPPKGITVQLPYGLILLAGLIPYNVLSQVAGAAPAEVLKRPNYVTKVRFPLEVLPVVRLGVSTFHGVVGLSVLLAGEVVLVHYLPSTVLLLPLAFVPLVLLTLGLGWFLASLGVYFRDLQNMMVVVLRIWFFATPIVYPASRLPRWAVWIVKGNPLAFIVSATRDVLLWGRMFSLGHWLVWSGVTLLFAAGGYWWFQYTKQGFADVL